MATIKIEFDLEQPHNAQLYLGPIIVGLRRRAARVRHALNTVEHDMITSLADALEQHVLDMRGTSLRAEKVAAARFYARLTATKRAARAKKAR